MFAILILVTAGTLTASLYYLSPRSKITPIITIKTIGTALWQLEPLGLVLVTARFRLLLLPLTIANKAPHGYHSGYIIAIFIISSVSLILFPVMEWFIEHPAINLGQLVQLSSTRDILIAMSIAVADAISIMISYTPAYNWVRITFNWNVQNIIYFLNAASLSVVVFGILGGIIVITIRWYK